VDSVETKVLGEGPDPSRERGNLGHRLVEMFNCVDNEYNRALTRLGIARPTVKYMEYPA